MKAGETIDGTIIASVINTGFDTMEELKLFVKKDIGKVLMLDENGNWKEAEFIKEDNFVTVKKSAETLLPVILKLS